MSPRLAQQCIFDKYVWTTDEDTKCKRKGPTGDIDSHIDDAVCRRITTRCRRCGSNVRLHEHEQHQTSQPFGFLQQKADIARMSTRTRGDNVHGSSQIEENHCVGLSSSPSTKCMLTTSDDTECEQNNQTLSHKKNKNKGEEGVNNTHHDGQQPLHICIFAQPTSHPEKKAVLIARAWDMSNKQQSVDHIRARLSWPAMQKWSKRHLPGTVETCPAPSKPLAQRKPFKMIGNPGPPRGCNVKTKSRWRSPLSTCVSACLSCVYAFDSKRRWPLTSIRCVCLSGSSAF